MAHIQGAQGTKHKNELERFSGFAVCGFRFVEHVVFMKDGIINGLAVVCISFMIGWGLSRTMKVDLVQHDMPVLLKEE